MKVIYTCHYCGKEAVFGEHFCKEARKVRKAMKKGGGSSGPAGGPGEKPEQGGTAGKDAQRDPDRDLGYEVPAWEKKARKDRLAAGPGEGGRGWRILGYLASALVAAALVAALLYGTVGILAFWVIPLALLIGLAAALIRKSGAGGRRYGELLALIGNDRELAGRLIQAEAGRHPEAALDTLVDLAIQRLLRDRLR